MKENITEDLLIRYILEEADTHERTAVETWLQESETHQKQYEQTKFILDTSRNLAEKSPLSDAEAWNRFEVKRQEMVQHPVVRKLSWFQWPQLAAASIILICVALGGYYFYKSKPDQQNNWVTINAASKILTDTLPDGSVICLNKNASVTYNSQFNGSRAVKLKGEAFFKVIHNEKAPFTVHAGEVTIRDIGTSFNVNAQPALVEVIVESGLVNVSRHSSSVKLIPKQMVSIEPGNTPIIVNKMEDVLYQYYVTNKIVANNTPLYRIVKILNEAYNAHIEIDDKSLLNIPITTTFDKNEPLDKALDIIMLTTPYIHRENHNDKIILTR